MNVSVWLNLSAGLLRRGQVVENERFCLAQPVCKVPLAQSCIRRTRSLAGKGLKF